ncbi:MAG: hypothetical protein JWO31_4060 [Phycisphaerales bacterium]|nr:hypothetical protein [Phycisphaerales bacterium]
MSWRDRDYGRNRRPPDDGHGYVGDGPADDDDDDFEPDEEDDAAPAAGRRAGKRDDPDPSDLADGDEPAFIRCPNCRKLVADDAEQCPKCGHYLIDEEIGRTSRPAWVWVGIVLALLMAVGWALSH